MWKHYLLYLMYSITHASVTLEGRLPSKLKNLGKILGLENIGFVGEQNYKTLDELYGSGEFDNNENMLDSEKYMSSSVEGLIRLYTREKQLVKLLKEYKKEITKNFHNTSVQSLQRQVILNFPLSNDNLEGALVGLYRIQLIYNITYKNMVDGNISSHPSLPHHESVHTLNSEDCVHIANIANIKNDLEKTVDWLNVAKRLKEQEGKDSTFLSQLLNTEIKRHDSTALQHGKFILSHKNQHTTTRIEPFDKSVAKRHRKKIKKWKAEWKNIVNSFPMYTKSKSFGLASLYQSLVHAEKISHQCQNIPQSHFLVKSTLKCENLHARNVYLRLGPHKMERLSKNPPVSMFHQFLTQDQCDQLKTIGEGKMKATPLTIPKSSKISETEPYTDQRLSKIYYISHHNHTIASLINKKLEAALRLKLNNQNVAAENYQLMNYGLGGYIASHVDYDSYEKDPLELLLGGERLMTFMVYLSDIRKGGGGNTVFPLLGLSVPPTMGTALFWNTIKSDGMMDERMLHLGCPVVSGNKWIVNKWIRWHSHMETYPCYRDRRHYDVHN